MGENNDVGDGGNGNGASCGAVASVGVWGDESRVGGGGRRGSFPFDEVER